MPENDVYQENGYADRADYLRCMSEDYGVPIEVVRLLANVLGPNEDFDGLITELEDHSDMEE
jgi:hypothetical protein